MTPVGGRVTFRVRALTDADDEAGETIYLNLRSLEGPNVEAALGTLTLKNGPRPQAGVTVSAAALTLTEGGAADSYTVVLTAAPAAGETVLVTALSDRPAAVRVHGAGGSPGLRAVLTFTEQSWSTAQTVTVTPQDDADTQDASATISHTAQGTDEYSGVTAASIAVSVIDTAVTDTTVVPEVSVTGPASVTEGEDVTFTVEADPAPSRALLVELTVAQTGDFAADGQTGRKHVVIRQGESSATLTVRTTADDRSEPNGSVTATVEPRASYAVAAAGTAVVTVAADDGGGVPVVSVASRQEIAFEGDAVTFTLNVDPKPAAALQVSVDVAEAGGQGFVDPAATGTKTVTIAANAGSAIHTVPTVQDTVEESGSGTVTVTVLAGNGYLAAPSPHGAASVDVHDDDGIAFSIHDTEVEEGDWAEVPVTLSKPSPGGVSVSWSMEWIEDSTVKRAHWSRDLRGFPSGRLPFGEGETTKHVFIETLDDAHDDPDEKVLLVLSNPVGAAIADGEAWVTITNEDPMPAIAHSRGAGGYDAADASGRSAEQAGEPSSLAGRMESVLTSVIPYGAVRFSNRLALWGAAGHGVGEVTMAPDAGPRITAGTGWTMAAAGLTGELLNPSSPGPSLTLVSDALWARTGSSETQEVAASRAEVTRVRLGLAGSLGVALGGAGMLTPTLEAGVRYDGGGVEVDGGIAWSLPGLGLSLDVEGRTLLVHEERAAAGRWEAEAAYGVPFFDPRFVGRPHLGYALSDAGREYRVGWGLAPEAPGASDLSFTLEATRFESDGAPPDHDVGFEMTARW